MDRLQQELQRFRALASRPVGYAWSHQHDGGEYPFHVVFGSMVHGNEIGSLPAVNRVMSALRDGEVRCGGRVTFFIGNPEAGLEDCRFLERDLNRVFLRDATGTSHEERRARELMPILDTADLFLDFHQTILKTREPFYISPFQVDGWHWARALGAARSWVTRHPGQAFSSGTMCADEYVRLAGKPGLTVELSQKGFDPAAEANAARVMFELLSLLERIHAGEANLEQLASTRPELRFVETVHRQAFATPDHALEPGWVNFRPVQAGQKLHTTGAPAMVAPVDGLVLFPKYPADRTKALPREIFRIVRPMAEHPLDAYELR